ncbi:hypothetical protein GGI43DRAFT_122137 [Trichoderma evansii]
MSPGWPRGTTGSTCTSVKKRTRCALIGQCHSKLLRLAIRYPSGRVPLIFRTWAQCKPPKMLTDTYAAATTALPRRMRIRRPRSFLRFMPGSQFIDQTCCSRTEHAMRWKPVHLVPGCYHTSSSTHVPRTKVRKSSKCDAHAWEQLM